MFKFRAQFLSLNCKSQCRLYHLANKETVANVVVTLKKLETKSWTFEHYFKLYSAAKMNELIFLVHVGMLGYTAYFYVDSW